MQQHPLSVLDPQIISALRTQTPTAEAQGNFTHGQLKIIDDNKWLGLFVPRKYGGLALDLPAAIRAEEALAYADGSVGWFVTLCAGAALFVGFFDELLAAEVFGSGLPCIAGSGHDSGTAEITPTGYVINGKWSYASGAPYADWFTANCRIYRDGQQVYGRDGDALVRSFIFKKEEVRIHADWNYTGLNATAGHSFSVSDLAVSKTRTFLIDAAQATLEDPIYHFPFLQFAEATLAVNISGMCLSFFDLCEELLLHKHSNYSRSNKVKEKALTLISSSRKALGALRNDFYEAVEHSWQVHISNSTADETALKAITTRSVELAGNARSRVSELYPYMGMEAARSGTMLNQVWRNINTASQHNLLLAL